jgi:hypothetical protein
LVTGLVLYLLSLEILELQEPDGHIAIPIWLSARAQNLELAASCRPAPSVAIISELLDITCNLMKLEMTRIKVTR